MPTIAEVRQQYPQYSDMSDADLAGALHTKFYSDVPREEFDKKIGLSAKPAQRDVPDKLLGLTGERYQTWPERLVRGLASGVVSGATLPGDVAQGKVSMTGEDGHTNPEVINRSGELASIASPVSPAARLGVGWAGALKTEKTPAPTPQALATRADQLYDSARDLGVELPASNISGFADKVANHLFEAKGITPEQAPHTYQTLDRLRAAPPDATVTVPNLDALRQNFGHTAGNFNNSIDQGAALTAKQYLADHLASLTDQDAIRGPASTLASITKEANGNYAALKTDQEIGDALYKAGLETNGTHSGKNLDNKTRQAFVRILTNDKAGAGLRDNEIASAEAIVKGSKAADAARSVSKVLGGGGGLGMLHAAATGGATGFAIGGPIGGAIGAVGAPTIGHFLRRYAENSTQSKVDALREMIRGRSPLGESMPERVAGSVSPQQAALARALMLSAEPKK